MWEKVTSAWSLLLVGRRENELAEVSIRCQGALGWKVRAFWVQRDSEYILKPGKSLLLFPSPGSPLN